MTNLQKLLLTIFFIVSSQNISFAVGLKGEIQDSASFLVAAIHPWMGWDHVLAMVLVGMLAGHQTFYKGLILPSLFVISCVMSAFFASVEVGLYFSSYIELLILTSMFIFGLVFTSRFAKYFLPIATLVIIFGFAHGYAHGLELRANKLNILFGIGLSTAILHIVGYGLFKIYYEKYSIIFKAFGVGVALLSLFYLIKNYLI
jgi:urease accessory protein|tara:strand:- start:146 stop:751 length:606 start_codon:yes stop_codon:yes gene_type:complete